MIDTEIEHPDEIPGVLRDIRMRRRLRQSALAEKLGWTASQLSLYERMRQRPSTPKLWAWANELGLDIKLVRKRRVKR